MLKYKQQLHTEFTKIRYEISQSSVVVVVKCLLSKNMDVYKAKNSDKNIDIIYNRMLFALR